MESVQPRPEPTEEEWKAVWAAGWQAMDARVAALIDRWIGRAVYLKGSQTADLWFRKRWYINWIKDLMREVGICNVRQAHCKYRSPAWQRYEALEQDCIFLVDHLTLELLDIGRQPATTEPATNATSLPSPHGDQSA
jgi:hypothetical protein